MPTTKTDTLADYIKQHAESNATDDLRPRWRHTDTGPEVADIDDSLEFCCELPRDHVQGVTTDEIEAAIDDSKRDVVRSYLVSETGADVEIGKVEIDGYSRLSLTAEGQLCVAWTLEVEATLTR